MDAIDYLQQQPLIDGVKLGLGFAATVLFLLAANILDHVLEARQHDRE
jgi:hypothetical protein